MSDDQNDSIASVIAASTLVTMCVVLICLIYICKRMLDHNHKENVEMSEIAADGEDEPQLPLGGLAKTT